MNILKAAIGGVSVLTAGAIVGCAVVFFNPPEVAVEESAPQPVEEQKAQAETPVVQFPERETTAATVPAEMPATAVETPAATPSYSSYCNAPKMGTYSQYSDEEWCSQAQWLRDNGVNTEEAYVVRYNGVCPEAQPQNIHSAEWRYYAAVGGRTAVWPTPEHYAETAWNERHQGRLSGVWQASTFVNLGLPNNYANHHTFMYINIDTLTAYWQSDTDSYDSEWDAYTARATAKLQALESLFTSRCH